MKRIIAVCSCGQAFTVKTIQQMNTHGEGNPRGHQWVMVKDIILEWDLNCRRG